MIAIVNTKIVLPDSLIWDGIVLLDGGKIVDFGESKNVQMSHGAKVIDAGGSYTAPGFVDIHSHGGGGHWFYENPKAAAAHFLNSGTTTMLATLYNNLSLGELLDAFKKIKEVVQSGSILKGIYMEGPYLNSKYGGDAKNSKWKEEIDKLQYDKLIYAGENLVKVWCVSPERDGIEQFILDAKADGVIFSAAHTEATPEQLYKLMPHGLKLHTHHHNATASISPMLGVKGAGVDEAVMLCDDIYAELIVDSQAVHVNEYNLRLAVKTKGKNRIILISDATEYGSSDKSDAPDLRFDDNGDLCGSSLTLSLACANMMKHTGASLCDVFKFGSLNPATLLGMENQIGSIAKGKIANVVIVDDMIRVSHVILEGVQIR